MIEHKKVLSAIGDFLKERCDLTWFFVRTISSSTDSKVICLEDINVRIKFDEDNYLLVYHEDKDMLVCKKFQSPMQVIHYILNGKFEVR